MWVVVGLGNPGRKYSRTRHNVGFQFIRGIARNRNLRIGKSRYLSKVARVDFPASRALLAMPQTFMNASGQAVKNLLEQTGTRAEQVVVIFDDFDLPLGEIRIRRRGSGGSHKGMNSIIQETGTVSIPRIRIGIGPLPGGADPVEFVLSPFSPAERQILKKTLERAGRALEMILAGRIDKAMNLFNAGQPSSP